MSDNNIIITITIINGAQTFSREQLDLYGPKSHQQVGTTSLLRLEKDRAKWTSEASRVNRFYLLHPPPAWQIISTRQAQ